MPKRLPTLPDTGRHYLDGTRGGRLASPGIERYARRRGTTARVLVAAVLVAAMVALMLLLA